MLDLSNSGYLFTHYASEVFAERTNAAQFTGEAGIIPAMLLIQPDVQFLTVPGSNFATLQANSSSFFNYFKVAVKSAKEEQIDFLSLLTMWNRGGGRATRAHEIILLFNLVRMEIEVYDPLGEFTAMEAMAYQSIREKTIEIAQSLAVALNMSFLPRSPQCPSQGIMRMYEARCSDVLQRAGLRRVSGFCTVWNFIILEYKTRWPLLSTAEVETRLLDSERLSNCVLIDLIILYIRKVSNAFENDFPEIYQKLITERDNMNNYRTVLSLPSFNRYVEHIYETLGYDLTPHN